jgi:hypothetical protein
MSMANKGKQKEGKAVFEPSRALHLARGFCCRFCMVDNRKGERVFDKKKIRKFLFDNFLFYNANNDINIYIYSIDLTIVNVKAFKKLKIAVTKFQL